MSNQVYMWMLAEIFAWQQGRDNTPFNGPGLAMTDITAIIAEDEIHLRILEADRKMGGVGINGRAWCRQICRGVAGRFGRIKEVRRVSCPRR